MEQDIKQIFFRSVEEYNSTILSSHNIEKKKLMSYDERRGIFYNSLRRVLGGRYGNGFINYRWFPVTDLHPWFREDGTIGNIVFSFGHLSRNTWMEDDVTYELKIALSKLADQFEELGKNKDELLLCDIVNSLKIKM